MGTRNLIAIYKGGNYKLAQYNQWDGYPRGQGVDVLSFCREVLSNELNDSYHRFISNLSKIRFVDSKEELIDLERQARIDVSKKMWNSKESSRFYNLFPYFSRDHGAKLLTYILKFPEEVPQERKGEWSLLKREELNNPPNEILTKNSVRFSCQAGCEFAYVIDLDKEYLECYSSYPDEERSHNNRFREIYLEDVGKEEWIREPVALLASWPLNNLPSKKEFLNRLNKLIYGEEHEE